MAVLSLQRIFEKTEAYLLLRDVIKYTPVSKIIDAIIDCTVNFSSRKYQPIKRAITGFTYAEVDTFSGETTFNK